MIKTLFVKNYVPTRCDGIAVKIRIIISYLFYNIKLFCEIANAVNKLNIFYRLMENVEETK